MSRVVVIGAGQAGVEVAASLRQRGFEGDIVLASGEHRLPYRRPPLSKELLLGTTSEDAVALRAASFYRDKRIDLRPGDAVQAIDRNRQLVEFESGSPVAYDHVVLSTGARPRPLPLSGAHLDGVLTLHTVEDALSLKHRLEAAASLVVIGGGFIGMEVAAAAGSLGRRVTVLEALEHTMARAVSSEMSGYMTGRHIDVGIDVRRKALVTAITDDGTGRVGGVALESGERIPADLVLVGVGAVSNTELAVEAGLSCANGVTVDEHLRTADQNISAIGDCCSFPWRDEHVRLESVQNATDQARCVAASITGVPTAYQTVPWFWSFQGSSRLQIAGLTRGYNSTVLRGDPAGGSFSVFCFDGSTLVGVESLNAPADHVAARKLLSLDRPLSPAAVADTHIDLLQEVV